jgi:Glycoside-hydrolase family GH114
MRSIPIMSTATCVKPIAHDLVLSLTADPQNNDNGLGLTTTDSINFLTFLSSKAAAAGLSIGLKNAGEIVSKVLPVVQFSVNEQCVQYSECSTFAPFVSAGKPVFHIEYPSETNSATAAQFCGTSGKAAGASGFSTVIKNLNLDGWVKYCDGTTATTPSA